MTDDQLRARSIDDHARRIVETDVCYCVSSLIHTLAQREWDGSDGIDPDDLATVFQRQPDADDYREAASYSEENDVREIVVQQDGALWKWRSGPHDVWSTGNDSAVQAWREAFAEHGHDDPDGSEVLEHWLVTDWLAGELEEQGEAVARDIAGLTVWGRCTSGQAIYADGVLQRIARAVLEA